MRKKSTCFLSLLLLSTGVFAQESQPLSAQLNKVKLEFNLDNTGRPVYQVDYAGKKAIKPSAMGFELSNDAAFAKDFIVTSSQKISHDDSWKPVWGEVSSIRDHYEQLTVHLKQKNAPFRMLDIVFRVFEDGVGFRYVFPKQKQLTHFVVSKELTEFNQTGDHKAFWIPGDYDTNEYKYTTSALSAIDAWAVRDLATDIVVREVPDQHSVATPVMLKTVDGLYINIHEAALVNYPSMQLHVNTSDFGMSASLVPDATGNKAYLYAPFNTPWRTIIVSDKATDILRSKMILNLNEPTKLTNTDWIKPMKFMGVWWELQIGRTGWNYADSQDTLNTNGQLIPNGKHGANTTNVKQYIDFASKNGIKGLLVEGWNVGWEDWFGSWKENVFDFTTPYPDFDVKGIADYAKAKGVSMIMHNETSGAATTYERYLDTAFKFMNTYNYPAVKTGYVGKIIPRGEHHDGQWMVNHYQRVAQKAADHHVMLDSHESNRPTGLHRTFPNWMASEAGRGNEYNAFSTGNPPDHETIMPFTRYMGGPMDYTPGIFKLKGYAAAAPERQVHTTLAKQLALYVTLYSPLQMAADLPENYEAHQDAFQFIKDVATDWDDTKVVEAEPGDYISTARKAKGTANWFIGAITDEHSRTTNISLNFLDKGKKYIATIYADAPAADWQKNPEAYAISKVIVTQSTVLNLKLANGGGAAVSVYPATAAEASKYKAYKK